MTGFCIGQVNIDGRFIMAPMAGVTDRAFRQILSGVRRGGNHQ